MGSAVALGDVVGEAEDLLIEPAIPLHGNFNADIGALVTVAISHCVKHIRVKDSLVGVDELHKPAHTASTRKIVFFSCSLVFQLNTNAVVEEAQLAQALGQYVVVEIRVLLKNFGVG